MKLSVEGKAVGSLSKSDASIDPRILDSARREFLARGFEGASLQSICADAGVTTGALYKRYKGKADLFEAVVAPTLADIRALEEEAKRRDYALMDDKNLRELWALSEDIHRQWMIYFYERYEGMRLLLCCAEGTAYANFLHDFVARNTALCMEFVNEARRRDLPVSDIDAVLGHRVRAPRPRVPPGKGARILQAHRRVLQLAGGVRLLTCGEETEDEADGIRLFSNQRLP